MTIDRDQLKAKLTEAIADIETRTGGYMTFVELAGAVLDAILPEVQAQTLEDAADDWGSQIRNGGAGSWLRERAAEYWKGATK
jgi:hypothetical protein